MTDTLQRITAQARAARDLRLEIQDLEARLSTAKAQLRAILREHLPDLMGEHGVPSITIAAEGNMPACKIKIEPFARANISANWPEDQRQAAFEWLDANNAGDLIKTEVTVAFGKDARHQALATIDQLQRLGLDPVVSQAVNHMTLSKWLREALRRGLVVPLQTLGADVGMEAKITEE